MSNHGTDRRTFFTTCGRWLAGGALGTIAAVAGSRRRSAGVPGHEPCTRRLGCGQCEQLSRCGLPQAVSARRVKQPEKQDRGDRG